MDAPNSQEFHWKLQGRSPCNFPIIVSLWMPPVSKSSPWKLQGRSPFNFPIIVSLWMPLPKILGLLMDAPRLWWLLDLYTIYIYLQSWALLFCQSPFYVKIDSFWARDLISCVNGCFWPKWRWVNSFFDFCPFWHTFLTFFENPKKPKMSFFELETWFFGGREVFDQYEHGSTHFFISALLRSKMALYS